MKSLRIAELLQSPATDAEVVVKGWVRTKRGNKNVAFIALNDGSCVANMQVVVDLAKFDEELLRKVTTGACLRVDGRLVASCGAIVALFRSVDIGLIDHEEAQFVAQIVKPVGLRRIGPDGVDPFFLERQ